MSEETRIVEQIVVMFPSLAAWLIVALVGAIATGGGLAVRMFMGRMKNQDAMLGEIKELLASEIGKLRELHHDIDKRVVRLEAQADSGGKWNRRAGDQDGAPG